MNKLPLRKNRSKTSFPDFILREINDQVYQLVDIGKLQQMGLLRWKIPVWESRWVTWCAKWTVLGSGMPLQRDI